METPPALTAASHRLARENAFTFLTVFRNCGVRVKLCQLILGFDRTQQIRCPPVCQSIVPIARVESGSGTVGS